jgi:hypothetical protein
LTFFDSAKTVSGEQVRSQINQYGSRRQAARFERVFPIVPR